MSMTPVSMLSISYSTRASGATIQRAYHLNYDHWDRFSSGPSPNHLPGCASARCLDLYMRQRRPPACLRHKIRREQHLYHA
nr:hypothetical protein I308_04776 [Cryptococcus tetragattii IND107]